MKNTSAIFQSYFSPVVPQTSRRHKCSWWLWASPRHVRRQEELFKDRQTKGEKDKWQMCRLSKSISWRAWGRRAGGLVTGRKRGSVFFSQSHDAISSKPQGRLNSCPRSWIHLFDTTGAEKIMKHVMFSQLCTILDTIPYTHRVSTIVINRRFMTKIYTRNITI